MKKSLKIILKNFLINLPRLSFRNKVALLFCWAMIFVMFFSSYSIYQVALREATRQLGQRLMAIAVSGSIDIDGDVHKTLTEPADMKSPAYQAIKEKLVRLRDMNSGLRLRYVYTMRMVKKGYWTQATVDTGIYPNIPASSGHRLDFVTYVNNVGGVPAVAPATGLTDPTQPFPQWDQPSSRAWFALALWQAIKDR